MKYSLMLAGLGAAAVTASPLAVRQAGITDGM